MSKKFTILICNKKSCKSKVILENCILEIDGDFNISLEGLVSMGNVRFLCAVHRNKKNENN